MSNSMQTKQRLNDLLKYVYRLGQINEEPVFRVDEYERYSLPEHEYNNCIGIELNTLDNDGNPIWLKIERLKRNPPPAVPVEIAEWVRVSNDPDQSVQVSDSSDKGRTLAQFPDLHSQVESYVQEHWHEWAQSEIPRRQTIKIYDALFSLQQTMEAQGDEQALEFVWGLGVTRWDYQGTVVDYPLLEKQVEIEIDDKNGAIYVRPRNSSPNLVIGPYFALENPGIDALIRFEKKHFSQLDDDIDFSPYVSDSFEPVLRYAATQLSESGVYWPDVDPDNTDRKPPSINNYLQVSNCSILFARPRGATPFVQDIERFQVQLESGKDANIPPPVRRIVEELSDKTSVHNLRQSADPLDAHLTAEHKEHAELYFPKPFNDAQIQIIDRLESNDGVVVQGPPGTGKTHTIANIISHYLATGRSVLVTSNGESALTALRSQIPEEVRDLTISLLTNERQGFKQLENAVQTLATIASKTEPGRLQTEIHKNEIHVTQIRKHISEIDSQISLWGNKQLQAIDHQLLDEEQNITAMALAQKVLDNRMTYNWFPDTLGTGEDYNPLFTTADITELKRARKAIQENLSYIDKQLVPLNDLPDAAQIASIHADLVLAEHLNTVAKTEKLPKLNTALPDALERAKSILPELQDTLTYVEELKPTTWLYSLFQHWASKGVGSESHQLMEDLLPALKELITKRKVFLKNPVTMPDPGTRRRILIEAIANLEQGKSAFGLLALGKGDAKTILKQIGINGERPLSARQWQFVGDYIEFQDEVRRFTLKWNSIGEEFDLPELHYEFGDTAATIKGLDDQINDALDTATRKWVAIAAEIKELYPEDLRVHNIIKGAQESQRVLAALTNHTSKLDLGTQRKRLNNLQKIIGKYNGQIMDDFKDFARKSLGSSNYNTGQITERWVELIQTLRHLHSLHPHLLTLGRVTEQIRLSGAPKWAAKLLRDAVGEGADVWLPNNWSQAWQWRRQSAYISEIDGRGQLQGLTQKRMKLEAELKQVFAELVRLKTYLGLHSNLSERIHGALIRFVSAISRLGVGTGKKRAPRYRREALSAIEECFDGVPCWIMPTWRISETLPAEFGSFDLVIIDEASQSDIAALPAILRAKKLLVVGDDKQVSPTAAFVSEEKIHQFKQNYLRGQPFADLLIPGVSLYDLASVVYPTQRIMLNEHFRCVEAIVRFSMQFYNDSLVPLRLAKASEKLDPPLVDIYVKNGKRDDNSGTNNAEIQAIIEELRVITNDSQYDGRSIGIISLIGAEQAVQIQEVILQELGEDIYQKYNISCGDSATFQGKEKDIVFLSMVVGPKQGAVLNKREYQQRFNVALSRARDRMYLFRSVSESDLKNSSDLRLRVIRFFANPMPPRKQVDNPLDLCKTPLQADLYSRLHALGYTVSPQVGIGPFTLDLIVEGQQDRRLAIAIDGDENQSAQSWTEALANQRTLERVGWVFWRCWGSSYVLEPETCVADLISNLQNLGIEPMGEQTQASVYTEHREYQYQSTQRAYQNPNVIDTTVPGIIN